MADDRSERHKRSKSYLSVSLRNRDKSKENGNRLVVSTLGSDAAVSVDSLASASPIAGSMATASASGEPPRSPITGNVSNQGLQTGSSSRSTLSVSAQPVAPDATGTANAVNTAASLEQSIRTFRLFQILRNKDLEAISQELKGSVKDSGRSSPQDKTHAGLLNGATILHLAVQCAELSTVEYILAQPGVDVNARNKDGNTALHLAADLGRAHVVRALLDHDGIKGFLPNYHGQHPIDLAQNADTHQLLQLAQSLFFDAKVDEVHRLVSAGDYDGLQSLLTDPQVQAVIDPNATELVTDSATLQSGGTLLHEAARRRDARLIQLLLLNGADPFRCDHRGKLPQDVTKDDKTRALLKRSPAAAAAHRGIQERAILRGASQRSSITQNPNSSSDVTVAGKEAREMKGYLKKWTNYTGGYKLRWFVLEDGVLSYYKHQDDAGSACRGAINMKIARINMDPQDNQRFEIHGKSSVKYHLKASHVVEAKRWFWALNNAIQWTKDVAKEAERTKAREAEFLERKKMELSERSSIAGGNGLGRLSINTDYNDLDTDPETRGRIPNAGSSSLGPRSAIAQPALGPKSAISDDTPSAISPFDVGTLPELTYTKSHVDGSVADGEFEDEDEYLEDASIHDVRPVAKDAVNITAHSIQMQLNLLAQVTAAFQAEQTKNPDLTVGNTSVVQVMASYDAAIQSLRSLISDLLKISSDRDAFWQYRLRREVDMRKVWEESMIRIAKEQAALEGKMGESELKRKRAKKLLREILQTAETSAKDSAPISVKDEDDDYDDAAAAAGGGDTASSKSKEVSAHSPRPKSAASKLDKQKLMESVELSDSEPGEDDEFFDAIDSGGVEVVSSMHSAVAPSARPTEAGDEVEDVPAREKLRDIQTSYTGYEEPVRQRLKLDADDRPRISLWGVLKSMIGKDMTRMTLPVSFNEPTSLLQRVAEDMEYADLLDVAASRTESTERMVYVAGFAASEYSSTIGRVAKPFNPLLGETFEYVRPDKGYRFLVEQVSHHPPIGAVYSEAARWDYYGESAVRSKFYGKSFEFNHLGTWFLKLRPVSGGEELYSWKKVNASVVGIITNNPTVDNYGPMEIKNWTTGDVCLLDFKQRGWRAAGAYEVKGSILDSRKRPRWTIGGKWNDKIYAKRVSAQDTLGSAGDISGHSAGGPGATPAILVWQAHERPQGIPFNLTPFVITLNALPDRLRPYLPRTDTRLRPDQRAMEDGEYDLAATEKNRVEEKQRAKRRWREERGEVFVPKWFKKGRCGISGEEYWSFDGSYWRMRDEVAKGGVWRGPEDIF